MANNSEFQLMLAHNVDLYTDDPCRFPRQVLTPDVPWDKVPRAVVSPESRDPVGVVVHNGTPDGNYVEVPFCHVQLGDPEKLPKPTPNVYLGVSALTIQAVHRMNDRLGRDSKRPTDDLLCVYSEVWDDGDRLGVRGFSRPIPVYRKPVEVVLPEGRIEAIVRNACPYGVALYPEDAPDSVEPDYPVIHSLPGAPDYMMADHEERLLEDLSDQLGVPVYETSVVGVTNLGPDRMRPGELWIASPNVPLAAGAAALQGVIVCKLEPSGQSGRANEA